MAYGDFKDLNRRTAADNVLRDKAFNVAKNSNYNGYQRELASMVYKFFNKKTSGGTVKNEIMSNKKLAKELHKSIIREFEKRKVYSSFINIIWGADLADIKKGNLMHYKFNIGFRFLLCAIAIYGKYTGGYSFKR